MAYEVIPESGEEVVADLELHLSKKAQPFFFAVSNQALYIPRIKLFAVSDPFYFERVPLNQIRHVSVKRLRPYGLWVLAVLMVVAGVFSTFALWDQMWSKKPAAQSVSGWPIAIIVGGFLIPMAARGRKGLEIWYSGGKFSWKPPLVVDKASKEKISETFQDIIDSCEEVGVPVSMTA